MKIVLSSGDPAGVGPDIVLSAAKYKGVAEITILGDYETLAQRAQQIGYDPQLITQLSIVHIPVSTPVKAGLADPKNATHVLRQLDHAIQGCLSGDFDALVTAPVSKSTLCDGGINFSGHTEYLAQACNAQTVMLFVTPSLRVALATTHLPLREVAPAITSQRITTVATTVAQGLNHYFGITHPRIGVCGLNPHAGENQVLGDEEHRIIRPAIKQLQKSGLRIEGPLPADTAFIPQMLKRYDVWIGMYHDQVLPLIKHLAFDTAVNTTLGLPFPRTSVDHGTAFELAGSGQAKADNLLSALALAERMVLSKRKQKNHATPPIRTALLN